jgi:HlyD family secretion protein
VWASAVLLLAVGLGLWIWQLRRVANAAPSYTTQVVGRGNLTLTVTANGTITATQRKDVLMVPNAALRFTPTLAAAPAVAKTGMLSGLTPRMPGATRKSTAAGASTALAKQVWVWPVDAKGLGKGAATAVAVTPGISDGRVTEITGGDLKVGMLVITDQKTAAAK